LTNKQNESPDSAITTWSGFIYQGKVALYHTIKMLCENLEYNYVLQLDSLEDFAILHEKGKIISMHQVKAYKATNYGKYSGAFKKLNDKHMQCGNLYFHTAKKIHTKTVEQIESQHSNIKIYKYDGEPNCEVGEIDYKIESLCKKIYEVFYNRETFKSNDYYCKKTREYLDQIILKKVINIHQKVHDNVAKDDEIAYAEVIEFSDFKNIFDDDLNEKSNSLEYYLYLSIQDFHRYYQIYCIENEDNLNDENLTKLSFYMSLIEKFENATMERFIKNIIPHREMKFDTISDYKDNTLVKDEVRDAFFVILKELDEGLIENATNILWKCRDNQSYSATTINSGDRSKSQICQRIIENAKDNDLDILFEGNNLLTLEMSSESIYNDAKLVENIETVEDVESSKYYKNIVKCKKIKLISLDNAKGRINGE
jgi:hypothetical protein